MVIFVSGMIHATLFELATKLIRRSARVSQFRQVYQSLGLSRLNQQIKSMNLQIPKHVLNFIATSLVPVEHDPLDLTYSWAKLKIKSSASLKLVMSIITRWERRCHRPQSTLRASIESGTVCFILKWLSWILTRAQLALNLIPT